MRRCALTGLSLALALGAARADVAPPRPVFINVPAGGMYFLVVRRDQGPPARATAQLIGCVDDHPNCEVVHRRGLIGKRVLGFDGEVFHADADLSDQIPAAFNRRGAPETIEIDFAPPSAGGQPIRISFARRWIGPP